MVFLSRDKFTYRGVTIIAEGSSTLGFGHIRRSMTLAREIGRRFCVRLCIDLKGGVLDAESRDIITCPLLLTEDVSEITSDLVVLDLAPDSMSNYLSRKPDFVGALCLDLFSKKILPDICVNLLDHSGQMRDAYASIGRVSDYYEGAAYAVIRPEIIFNRPNRVEVKGPVSRVVIAMGGADPSRRTLDALKDLGDLGDDRFMITVILGPLCPSEYREQVKVCAPKQCELLTAPREYGELLASADLVLCSGGGSLLECMCLGKVAVVYPQSSAEDRHARFYVLLNACVMAEALADVVASEALRMEIASNAYLQVDGVGPKRISNILENLMLGSEFKR